ncbi:hypothetical protein G9A89_018839 [Geosiphon pyriformis]|nr:hypothetical protein G9A89_018839 [Geosiphon pyriformis]
MIGDSVADGILLFVCLEDLEVCSTSLLSIGVDLSKPWSSLKVWMGCKKELDSKGLLVSLVVVDNNSGVVVECIGLVVHIGVVDFEVWDIGIPLLRDLGLPEGCCPAESALTYYINTRINYHIGKEEEPHDAKLGLYRELSQYTTKEVAVIAATIVKIHREIEQYAKKNFPISTGNTRECTNKTKENLETNQESNQQKLGTPAQTPKKTVTQSIKKQRIYSPEDKSYHFSPENKIQIPLGAALSSTSTPQTPRTSSYIDKIKQRTADSWYQSLETKPTSFAEFKNALLEYFSDPNAVIQLQNKFNTIKQNTSETVTQYLARFNRIRHQIEAIEQGYYTDPQVLNQFIRGLKSSILGRVHPAHPNSLPEAITLARALESAEKEANHSQMVNMVMEENKTETLEKRVTRLGEELSKKIESYLIPDPRKNTYQPPQRCSQEVSDSRNNRPSRQEFRTETRTCHFCKCVGHLISQCRT